MLIDTLILKLEAEAGQYNRVMDDAVAKLTGLTRKMEQELQKQQNALKSQQAVYMTAASPLKIFSKEWHDVFNEYEKKINAVGDRVAKSQIRRDREYASNMAKSATAGIRELQQEQKSLSVGFGMVGMMGKSEGDVASSFKRRQDIATKANKDQIEAQMGIQRQYKNRGLLTKIGDAVGGGLSGLAGFGSYAASGISVSGIKDSLLQRYMGGGATGWMAGKAYQGIGAGEKIFSAFGTAGKVLAEAAGTNLQSLMSGRVGDFLGRTFSGIFAGRFADTVRAHAGPTLRAIGGGALSLGGKAVGMGASALGGLASTGMEIGIGALGMMASVAIGGILALTAAMVAGGIVAISLAADYEKTAIALTTMVGDAEQGKQLLDDITKLAIATPFHSKELVGGAKMLKSFGFETEQVIPTLHALGEVASGTGTELDRLILAYGQVKVAGRLMGPELRQFTNAGVDMIHYLSEVTGKPEQAIKKMVEDGKISFGDVVQAMSMMTEKGGRFFGLMDKQTQTVSGRWQQFSENLQVALRNIGLAFFKGFGLADLVKEFSDATSGLAGQASQLEPFFMKTRDLFDMLRAGVVAVVSVLSGDFMESIGIIGQANASWDDFTKLGETAVRTLVRGLGILLDTLREVAVTMADKVLRPMGEALQAMNVAIPPEMANKVKDRTYAGAWMSGIYSQEHGFFDQKAREEFGAKFWSAATPEGMSDLQKAGRGFGGVLVSTADALKQVGGGASYADRFVKEFDSSLEGIRSKKNEPALVVGAFGQVWSNVIEMQKAYDIRLKVPYTNRQIEFASKVQADFMQGTSHFDEFAKTLEKLDEALYGQGKSGGLNSALTALGGFGGLGGVGGVLTPEEYDHGLFKTYEKLRDSVKDRLEFKFPPAALKGSQAAQDTINRGIFAQRDQQQEILDVIQAAKDIAEEQKNLQDETVKVLKQIQKQGGLQTVVVGPNLKKKGFIPAAGNAGSGQENDSNVTGAGTQNVRPR